MPLQAREDSLSLEVLLKTPFAFPNEGMCQPGSSTAWLPAGHTFSQGSCPPGLCKHQGNSRLAQALKLLFLSRSWTVKASGAHYTGQPASSGCIIDCTKHFRKGMSQEVIFIELNPSQPLERSSAGIN